MSTQYQLLLRILGSALAYLSLSAGGCGPGLPEPDSCEGPMPVADNTALRIGSTRSGNFVEYTDGRELDLIFGGQGGAMIPVAIELSGSALPTCMTVDIQLTGPGASARYQGTLQSYPTEQANQRATADLMLIFDDTPSDNTPADLHVQIGNNSDSVSLLIRGGGGGPPRGPAFEITEAFPRSTIRQAGYPLEFRIDADRNAGPDGLTYELSHDSSDIDLPASVTIPQGESSVFFEVCSGIDKEFTITARQDEVEGSATGTWVRTPLQSFGFLEALSIEAEATATLPISLSEPAPPCGLRIELEQETPVLVEIPDHVEVPAGESAANVTVSTGAQSAGQMLGQTRIIYRSARGDENNPPSTLVEVVESTGK